LSLRFFAVHFVATSYSKSVRTDK